MKQNADPEVSSQRAEMNVKARAKLMQLQAKQMLDGGNDPRIAKDIANVQSIITLIDAKTKKSQQKMDELNSKSVRQRIDGNDVVRDIIANEENIEKSDRLISMYTAQSE